MPAFPDVPKIPYEGPDSKNPLAFRQYNPGELVEGRQKLEGEGLFIATEHFART